MQLRACNKNTDSVHRLVLLVKQQILLRDSHLYQLLVENLQWSSAKPQQGGLQIYGNLLHVRKPVHLEILIYGFLLIIGLLEVGIKMS